MGREGFGAFSFALPNPRQGSLQVNPSLYKLLLFVAVYKQSSLLILPAEHIEIL